MNKEDLFILTRWGYGIGSPLIGDIEYNKLKEEIKQNNLLPEYTGRVWSSDPCPIELLQKHNRMDLYRDIKILYKSESMESIISEAVLQEYFLALDAKSRLSFKIDGWNIQINYYNGKIISVETRARTGNALNANSVIPGLVQDIPILGKVKIAGELNIPNNKWEQYKSFTGNKDQRASVSTVLANGDYEYIEFMAFEIQGDNIDGSEDSYSLLKSLGFKTPLFHFVSNFDQLSKAIDRMDKEYKFYNFLCDGLVLENKQTQVAIRIRGFHEKTFHSYVEGYEENWNSYGNSFSIKVHPITREGKTYTSVNVVNQNAIYVNRLKIGSPIAFNLRSQANSVIDTIETRELQEVWSDREEEYKEMIDSSN